MPGFQVFSEGTRLAGFIDYLIRLESESLCLVLNGDVVDFLAEDDSQYFDPDGAIASLERISKDMAFAAVFDALERFLGREGRHLVIVLGNHDVEMALPDTRQWLTERLAKQTAARGRLTFAVDGSGWSCRVGGARVLCVHGNEVDDWNVVDHRALLAVLRARQRGMAPKAWVPNGGTRLVIDVMNDIKKTIPMIDLLKPETRAVLPLVAAFKPQAVIKIADIVAAISCRGRDGLRMRAGWLGEEEENRNDRAAERLDGMEEIYKIISSGAEDRGGDYSTELLERVLESRRRGVKCAAEDDGDLGSLALGARIAALLSGDKITDVFRLGLRRLLIDDQSFDLDHQDKCYDALTEQVGNGVHFLVTGHTHLRRAIARGPGGGMYFNTGTWMRLIRIDGKTLDDPVEFSNVLAALRSPRMAGLDAALQSGQPLIRREPTAARIWVGQAGTEGALYDIRDDGKPLVIESTRSVVQA